MRIPFGKPCIGKEEIDSVLHVMEGPILVHGPIASEFENSFAEFTGAPYSISTSSCTAGMHLVYFSLGYGPGDEVIVSAQTHIATAHAVELTGAKAVFVDAEDEFGNIDVKCIERSINSRTRAIAVVHYLGVPADMKKIICIAKKYNLFVVEDCALAPGAKLENLHVGLHGDVGVFSFYPIKHLTTAEGGMVITKHEELATKIRHLRAFGVNRNHGERKIPGLYDCTQLGFNYRMSEIHAAIGVVQMKKLPKFLEKRRENYECLKTLLKDLSKTRILPQPVDDNITSSHYCLGLILDEEIRAMRPFIMSSLGEKGIGSSIYYPSPVPRMSYYRNKYGYDSEQFKSAESISDSIISLPIGPHLSDKDMFTISEELKTTWRDANV